MTQFIILGKNLVSCLLSCVYSIELQAPAMEFSEAGLRVFRKISVHCLSYPFGIERFVSPYTWHHSPPVDVIRANLCLGERNSRKRYPMVSAMKGHSATSAGLCEVIWIVEADLEAGQLLYITGDPIVLGCLDPDMAILMSPTEHANLWKTQVKIATGTNFRYNYFIKEETWPSCDITWRPGPEFSLSIPFNANQERKVVVRDSWMRFSTDRSHYPSWGSWIEDTWQLPFQYSLSDTTDEDKSVNPFGGDFDVTNPLLNTVTVQPLVEDVEVNRLLNDVKVEDSFTTNVEKFNTIYSNNHQPVEEPWLFQSCAFSDASQYNGSVKNAISQLDIYDESNQVTETLFPGAEPDVTFKDSVSTTILINSSICTMQRIAVLEDEKLVELLLEPVKSNVQCDSVYIGVVSKLVPHMGGAFVNIGNSRHSLMDIKQNRGPFIFPPFRKTTDKEVNGSAPGSEETSDDVDVIDDIAYINANDSAQFLHNDYEEHDIDDDFDTPEALKGNINGAEVNFGGAEADIEELDGREQHLEGKIMNGLLNGRREDSNGSKVPYAPSTKDSTNSKNNDSKWAKVRKGTKIIVQVVKEGLGTKGPTLTAYPKLRSRFWVLLTCYDKVGVSKKIIGVERTRLKVIAKTLQPQGCGLTVRTVASGHSLEELQKDLEGLLSTWKSIMEHAKSAALAADEGVEGAIPVLLHMAMGQTLSVVQDYFSDKVERMVVDSPRTYHEVTNYLQDLAPDLCDRVELHHKRIPLFDEFNIEGEINNLLSKRVPLANGGSLVIEQTEALVSVDVNGGHGMLRHGNSQEKAILDVNLAAAKQIARELRLRDIGGIIVVDFIDMADESNKRLVYEEVKRAVERDKSIVKVSELSNYGLMEMTRMRVRPSVTFMISEPCACCHATGRVEALETSFSKVEQEIYRLLVMKNRKPDAENPKSWPKFILRVDHHMCNYLTSGKRTKLAILSSSLKVWIILKVARGFSRGAFEVKPFTGDNEDDNQNQLSIPLFRSAEVRSNNSGRKLTFVAIKKRRANRK